MSRLSWHKSDLSDDLLMAPHRTNNVWTWLFLISSIIFFVLAILWAANAHLDEVTRGQGRIIPSGKVQIIQSLEGGLIKDINVKVGDRVKEGQLLLRIDDTNFASSLGELQARQYGLMGKVARLEAEIARRGSIAFPEDLKNNAQDVITSERKLFRSRRSKMSDGMGIMSSRKEQRQQELMELRSQESNLAEELALAEEDLAMNEKVSDIIPQSDLLKLRKEVSRLSGELRTTKSSLLKAEAAVREAQGMRNSEWSSFRQDAQAELTEAESELNVLLASSRAADDRVNRADMRSPVDGIVNAMHVNTLGGVVQPGSDLLEIVPFGDNLLIEARIRPQDIAFLTPQQHAKVKITAYDYSIYGGVEGIVERIGADSLTDEITGETYFPIDIRTYSTLFGKTGEPLPVTPGMVASVDIITGRKTVLQYLLKPINKAMSEGLRER